MYPNKVSSSKSSVWSSSTSKFKSPFLGQIDVEACKVLQSSLSARNGIDGGNQQLHRVAEPKLVSQAVDMFGVEIKEVCISAIIHLRRVFTL